MQLIFYSRTYNANCIFRYINISQNMYRDGVTHWVQVLYVDLRVRNGRR